MEGTVSRIPFFNVHRSWEDWVSMLVGVLIGFSPWLPEQQDDPAVLGNALRVGLLVFGLAQLTYVSLTRWEEIGEIACGLWLITSPFRLATPIQVHSAIGISSLARP
jgi:hypothetical protein